jgi:hypothetical protein
VLELFISALTSTLQASKNLGPMISCESYWNHLSHYIVACSACFFVVIIFVGDGIRCMGGSSLISPASLCCRCTPSNIELFRCPRVLHLYDPAAGLGNLLTVKQNVT